MSFFDWLFRGRKYAWDLYDRIKEYQEVIKAQKEEIKGLEAEVVRQKELIKAVPSQELPPFNYKKPLFSGVFLNFRVLRDRWWMRRAPDKVFIANFELLNGKHKSFLVRGEKGVFDFRGGSYVIDNDCKYDNLDAKFYMLDYHEGCSLPIRRVFPVTEINNSVGAVNPEITHAVNPLNLRNALQAKLVEGVIQGAQMDAVFRFIKLMLIIIAVVSVVTLVYILFKTGAFNSVKGALGM